MQDFQWIERAKTTFNFHRSKLTSHDKWTLAHTAKALRRSQGSICEDLLLARWLRTHERQLKGFRYAYEALEYVRKEQRRLETDNGFDD